MNDDELRKTLNEWKAPEPGASVDKRVLAAYRENYARPALWRRILLARISVPVPVAAALVLLIAVWFALGPRGNVAPAPPAPVAVQPAPTPTGEPVVAQRLRIENFRPVARPELRVIR